MKIHLFNGLPIVQLTLEYNEQVMVLQNILLDTGCATTIFDTDLVEEINLLIDPYQGRAVRMFGVGGQSEVCFQQSVTGLKINGLEVQDFSLQLGMTRIPYGFDGIIGSDFLSLKNLVIDFNIMEVRLP